MTKLGLTKRDLQILKSQSAHPHGLIVVTGPTGSGKTTTLAAVLSHLNDPSRKILTIEDPVEYQVEGVNQIQIRPEIGLTFASTLRSLLRLDPDIIMVGEMRDSETAKIGVNASLTGHLVLTTLHTNSAAGAVTRLLDLDVQAYLIASTLRCVIAQRLVRRLCASCRQQHDVIPDDLAVLAEGEGLKIGAEHEIVEGGGLRALRRLGLPWPRRDLRDSRRRRGAAPSDPARRQRRRHRQCGQEIGHDPAPRRRLRQMPGGYDDGRGTDPRGAGGLEPAWLSSAMPRSAMMACEVSGTMEGADRSAVIRRLSEQGQHAVDVRRTAPGSVDPPACSRLGGSVASFSDISIFTRELAWLLRAGMSLNSALEMLMKESFSSGFSAVISDMRTAIRKGRSFHEAMAETGVFSPYYVSMIEVGEASGTLAAVLERIAISRDREQKLRGKLGSALDLSLAACRAGAGRDYFHHGFGRAQHQGHDHRRWRSHSRYSAIRHRHVGLADRKRHDAADGRCRSRHW